MEELLAVYFINEKNIKDLKREFETTILPSKPNIIIEFKIDMVVVIQTIHLADLFENKFRCSSKTVWLATREEFDTRFKIINDVFRTDTFAFITRK